MAVQAGASFVGVIMSKPFRRHVPPEAASAIFRAVRQSGAEPVGVFVNEDAEAITQICKQAGLQTVQLHGTASRTALPSLPQGLQVIYVMHASTDGEPITVLPEEVQRLQKAAVTRYFQGLVMLHCNATWLFAVCTDAGMCHVSGVWTTS